MDHLWDMSSIVDWENIFKSSEQTLLVLHQNLRSLRRPCLPSGSRDCLEMSTHSFVYEYVPCVTFRWRVWDKGIAIWKVHAPMGHRSSDMEGSFVRNHASITVNMFSLYSLKIEDVFMVWNNRLSSFFVWKQFLREKTTNRNMNA